MAEAVGLALSVLPIVIWALEKYSEPLEAYTGYHNAISTLQANLQIQRMHLEATFQSIGLRHPTPRELHECLRQKFPQNHREILFIIRQMDDMMMKLMENLQVDMSRKVRYFSVESLFARVLLHRRFFHHKAFCTHFVKSSPCGHTNLRKGHHGNGAASNEASAQRNATRSSTICATGTTTSGIS